MYLAALLLFIYYFCSSQTFPILKARLESFDDFSQNLEAMTSKFEVKMYDRA